MRVYLWPKLALAGGGVSACQQMAEVPPCRPAAVCLGSGYGTPWVYYRMGNCKGCAIPHPYLTNKTKELATVCKM